MSYSRALKRRHILGFGLIGGLGLVLRPAAVTRAEGANAIRIANAAGSLNLTMKELMKQRRFFEDFGLDASVTDVADGAKIVGAIVGGDVDASTMSGFGQVFPAIEKGARLKILAGAALLPSLAVFSSKGYVNTIGDLAGRTVGTGSLGSLLHQLMVALLRKKGVDPGAVRFVNVGSSADVFRAVTAGVIDAGPGEIAIIDELERFGVHAVAGGNMSLELPEYTYQGAWASERAIETKRDLLVRTLAAYAKLYRFVQMPDAKDAFLEARATVAPGATSKEGESLWAYVQKYRPFAVDLVLTDERLRYMQQLNVDLAVQRTMLPFERVADISLATEAIQLLH
jgi:ABC-type nitrate/sulfonate/bicarbonate transport system substrate-binding protein